uniref:L-asparaginase-like n=1 Tax=Lepisosteus oculatus TaxID=7918 RepID=W5M1N0_LEPOC|nr:PREDICTED: L-asparaginase-like [Lepisosteus oculatus]
MGARQSRRAVPEPTCRLWAAVASSIRSGWLGINDRAKELKVIQMLLFPVLMCTSARQGDIVALEAHLQQGADVSIVDSHRRTPLHLAASEGDIETVRFLLKSGANINSTDNSKDSALRDAIRCKSIEVVEHMVSEGAYLDTSPAELGAEMCCLAHLGDAKQMEVWKAAGVHFNYADYDGRTPLHVAVCTNQPEMVIFCTRNGSNLEHRDRFNNRPIDDGHQLGLPGIVELLGAEKQRLEKEAADAAAQAARLKMEEDGLKAETASSSSS